MQQMQQIPVFLPPNFAGGEGMIMLVPAQAAPQSPPKNWNQSCAKGVGIATITVAVVGFVVNIGWFSVSDGLSFVGVGFWAGIPMATVGILLTIGGFRPKKGVIISVLVMSIVANVMAIGYLAVGGAQMNYRRSDYYYSYDVSYDSYSYIAPTTTTTTTTSTLSSAIGMGTFYVIVGLASFGLLLTASILSCYSVCSDCGKKVAPYPTIFCIPQGLVRNPDGSVTQPAYSFHSMQLPTMSYGYAPQGMTPSPPPPYPVYPATAPNLNSQILS